MKINLTTSDLLEALEPWVKHKLSGQKITNIDIDPSTLEIIIETENARPPSVLDRQTDVSNLTIGSKFPPEDFEPDQRFHMMVKHRNPEADIELELEKFRNHEFARPKTDWQRAWAQWWLGAKPSRPAMQAHSGWKSFQEQKNEENEKHFAAFLAAD